MKDCSKLQVFSRGFLQDALTLMKMMEQEGITRQDIEHYIKKPKPVDFTKMPISEKYKIFRKKNPNSNMTIEEFIKEIRAGRAPCKGCEDKKG